MKRRNYQDLRKGNLMENGRGWWICSFSLKFEHPVSFVSSAHVSDFTACYIYTQTLNLIISKMQRLVVYLIYQTKGNELQTILMINQKDQLFLSFFASSSSSHGDLLLLYVIYDSKWNLKTSVWAVGNCHKQFTISQYLTLFRLKNHIINCENDTQINW